MKRLLVLLALLVSSAFAGIVTQSGPRLFTPPGGGGDSVLAQACAALSSGQSASFTSGAAHGLPEAYVAWQSLGYHDTVNGLLHVMGKPAASFNWALRTYDIAADTWADNDPTISKDGHIYGGLTMDPATGDLYLHPGASPGADRALYRYRTGSGWSVVADPVFANGLNLPTNGVGWHPNLYGTGAGGTVTMAEVSGLSEGLSLYKASNSAIQEIFVGEGDLGRFYGQGVYFGAVDRLVLGGNKHIHVAGHATTPTWVAVGAPPIPTDGDSMEANPGGFGTMMVHPGNAAKMILLQRGGARDYYTSTDGDTWSSSLGAHPFTADAYALIALGDDMGCVMSAGAVDSTSSSTLWKPAP